MEIRDRYCDYIPVNTDGLRHGNFVACATAFPSNTVLSMILHDSASILKLKSGQSLKPWEQIKD